MAGHSKSVGSKACLYLKQQCFIPEKLLIICSGSACRAFIHKLRAEISFVNLYRTHLGVIEVDDCAIVLDHVDLLNARDIVH